MSVSVPHIICKETVKKLTETCMLRTEAAAVSSDQDAVTVSIAVAANMYAASAIC